MAMQVLYGPPPSLENIQIKYGVPNSYPVPAYGVPDSNPILLATVTILSIITSPIFIVCSFIVGSILYLITHKKIFIIIPLILSFFCLIRYFIIDNLLGLRH